MKKYIYLIGTTLLSLLLGVFYIEALMAVDHSIDTSLELVLIILLVILGVLITVFLYDVGHFIFAKIAKYRVASFKILNTDFYKIDGKIKYSNYPVKDHESKIVIASDKENNHYVTYYLGGVYTNLIISIIVAIIIMFSNASGMTYLLLVIFGFGNVVSAFVNVFPVSFFYNDGYYLYSLMKDPVALQSFHKKNQLVYNILNGKNMDECNFSIYKIDNLNNDYNDPLILELKELETYYYLYRFQFREALETIDYVFEKSDHMLALYQKAFTNLKIVTLVMLEENEKALELYLSLTPKHKKYIAKCKTIDDALAALAMHLKININLEQAKLDYDMCKKFSESTPYLGEREPLKDLIDLMMETKAKK